MTCDSSSVHVLRADHRQQLHTPTECAVLPIPFRLRRLDPPHLSLSLKPSSMERLISSSSSSSSSIPSRTTALPQIPRLRPLLRLRSPADLKFGLWLTPRRDVKPPPLLVSKQKGPPPAVRWAQGEPRPAQLCDQFSGGREGGGGTVLDVVLLRKVRFCASFVVLLNPLPFYCFIWF